MMRYNDLLSNLWGVLETLSFFDLEKCEHHVELTILLEEEEKYKANIIREIALSSYKIINEEIDNNGGKWWYTFMIR